MAVTTDSGHGQEAFDRLFEALRLLSTVRQFSELKRARNPF